MVRGAYLLRIDVPRALSLAFGRFQGGRPVDLSGGTYVYVGTAMGRSATSLPGRLLRHATRSGDQPPHTIRRRLQDSFATLGLRQVSPAGKRLHWHIDYLLDQPAAILSGVIAILSAEPVEAALAGWLVSQDGVTLPAARLGAADNPGHTHLVRVSTAAAWWQALWSGAPILPFAPESILILSGTTTG